MGVYHRPRNSTEVEDIELFKQIELAKKLGNVVIMQDFIQPQYGMEKQYRNFFQGRVYSFMCL